MFLWKWLSRYGLLMSAVALLFIGEQSSSGQVQRALLSVDGMSIPESGALAAFNINTWGVGFLAVCQIPPQWEWKQEKYMDPEGLLSGHSDPYHRTVTKLDRMFLVDVYSYQPLPRGNPGGEYHPASFSGWFQVFDGNGTIIKKRRKFHADNFRLTPAARCPDAPPAQP